MKVLKKGPVKDISLSKCIKGTLQEKWDNLTTDVHLHNILHFKISEHICTLEEGVNKYQIYGMKDLQ